MTAEALPFRRRLTGGGGAGGSGSDTFCLLGRRADRALAGSGSGTGLGSRAGALRFLDGAGGLIGGAAAGVAAAEVGEGSEEIAACRADARVLLGDMSIWLCNFALNLRHLYDSRSVIRVEADRVCDAEIESKRVTTTEE
jgi:hypothetical protein